ncbi:MAG: SAM-dependent methyltransferase [Candidatus Thiodiazotropha endolucinida]|nr:SAM-dependent methyltransferase [Candidatus Thiodiazotropha taylori]MCW4314275.1 SAM-dependent methyltransferase [Candidatus Thiodiazotropha taylori]
MPGSLTIVGTGITVSQITHEARMHIKTADKLFHLVADPITNLRITELNSTAESLYDSYEPGKERMKSYMEMVERMLKPVREGKSVCVALYGHPGVFVYPSHRAIEEAKMEGFEAKMLPAVSAEDCLFSDVGFDPARSGCQSYEATDFLLFRRKFDPASALILWQIGVIGDLTFQYPKYKNTGLLVLIEHLLNYYPSEHEVIVYEASSITLCKPKIDRVTINKLKEADVTPISTLYVPPANEVYADELMADKLGLKDVAVKYNQRYHSG